MVERKEKVRDEFDEGVVVFCGLALFGYTMG